MSTENSTDSTPEAPPPEPQAGGSYTRDPETGALTLVHRTEPAPSQE